MRFRQGLRVLGYATSCAFLIVIYYFGGDLVHPSAADVGLARPRAKLAPSRPPKSPGKSAPPSMTRPTTPPPAPGESGPDVVSQDASGRSPVPRRPRPDRPLNVAIPPFINGTVREKWEQWIARHRTSPPVPQSPWPADTPTIALWIRTFSADSPKLLTLFYESLTLFWPSQVSLARPPRRCAFRGGRLPGGTRWGVGSRGTPNPQSPRPVRRCWSLLSLVVSRCLSPAPRWLRPLRTPRPTAAPGLRLSPSALRVRSTTTGICGITVDWDSAEP